MLKGFRFTVGIAALTKQHWRRLEWPAIERQAKVWKRRAPMFAHYAVQSNPPIHILVNNRGIELKGVVGARLEKQLKSSPPQHYRVPRHE